MRFLTKKLLVLTALAAPAFAGTETVEPSQGDTTAAVSSQADDFQRFSAVPILGYTEETKYQFGAMAIIFFRPEFEGGNATELDLSFYGTTRKQVTGSISPKFFFLKDQISGDLDLHYENWVGNYFGRGNNPGLFFEINHTYIDFNRYHYYGSIEHPQNTDGWRNGIGYHLSLDTRDNTNWARHGYLVQWGHYFYNKALGDYSYTQQEFDIRGYTEFIWNTSMAVGLLWQRINGNAPFDKLAGSDGLKRFRGVEKNYFYGNQAMFLQIECRKKLFWRLAGDIFFEGGKTGDYFSDLMRNKWHRSLGFGGRLALNQKENLYARCELSWVDFKSVGMTMYVRDAF